MITQTLLIDNADEMEQQEAMGLQPKAKYRAYDFHIRIEAIHAAYINPDGNIVVVLPDGSWMLRYEPKLWKNIKEHLKY